jgi:hypothetical protein
VIAQTISAINTVLTAILFSIGLPYAPAISSLSLRPLSQCRQRRQQRGNCFSGFVSADVAFFALIFLIVTSSNIS